ncbi:MAG: VOC family protein [Dehalococcoidia bacterium]|nr:VOC family protein [Dehalococcoidia bacterium]
MDRIGACLWFDDQAEDAAHFYTGIFPGAKMGAIARYPETGQEITGGKPGSIMTVEFELCGLRFTALNGGPAFKFSEAVSFEVDCADQDEVDYYWSKLGAGGDPGAQQCGWLKDKFGVSWQVVPRAVMDELLNSDDRPKAERAFAAMLQMKKLDVAALRRAYNGE